MHVLYSAHAIIENQQPRTRREAIRQEEKFYADMAEASRFWRFCTGVLRMMKRLTGWSEQKERQGGKRTGCNHGQAESGLRVVTGSAGNGNRPRATDRVEVCGSVHTRFS